MKPTGYSEEQSAKVDLMLRSQQAGIELLRYEVKHLRGFATDLLSMWPGDIDGEDVQGIAVKHGLLKETIQYKPCGQNCDCSNYVSEYGWEIGITCYHKTEILTGE